VRSRSLHGKGEGAAGRELTVDGRPRLALADRTAHLLERALEPKLVPRLDDSLETGVVDAGEEGNPAAVLLLGEDGDRPGLRHRLDDQHTRHHRPARKVAAEVPLVLPDVPARDHALTRADVAGGVDHEPVKPGRELRLATELADPDAELGERFLSGVASVLRVGEQVPGKALHLRRVTFAQRLECTLVAVLSSLDQDRIAQPLVDERPL